MNEASCVHEWKWGEDVCVKCGKKGGVEPVDPSRIAYLPMIGTVGESDELGFEPEVREQIRQIDTAAAADPESTSTD